MEKLLMIVKKNVLKNTNIVFKQKITGNTTMQQKKFGNL